LLGLNALLLRRRCCWLNVSSPIISIRKISNNIITKTLLYFCHLCINLFSEYLNPSKLKIARGKKIIRDIIVVKIACSIKKYKISNKIINCIFNFLYF
jgi:hypothetical protein